MYNIGISEIIITDRQEDEKHLSIKYIADAASRPVCEAEGCSHMLTPSRHDMVDYLLHDVKSEGKLVDLRKETIYGFACAKAPRCPAKEPWGFRVLLAELIH
ncbi:MAG: hypothetical protein IJT34_02485 [Butyrivibrio sp.]|nr:hypothetical protein [Butyrivibrio sp.]